ncbi:transposase [Streptomyces sp. WM6372]|uniref:transposase n=1 Tax=Streptomyces sp. WM6372 TaxID=1415555 RepID=UPI000AFD8A19|nr:transposase [Streptomyces sp. WM6372]
MADGRAKDIGDVRVGDEVLATDPLTGETAPKTVAAEIFAEVVWDNASTHHAKALREFCDRNSDWLTIVKLPPYAPDLNPVDGVWAHLKTSLANLAPRTIDDLTPLVKNRLRGIQRRPEILDGFIAETGLGLEPP